MSIPMPDNTNEYYLYLRVGIDKIDGKYIIKIGMTNDIERREKEYTHDYKSGKTVFKTIKLLEFRLRNELILKLLSEFHQETPDEESTEYFKYFGNVVPNIGPKFAGYLKRQKHLNALNLLTYTINKSLYNRIPISKTLLRKITRSFESEIIEEFKSKYEPINAYRKPSKPKEWFLVNDLYECYEYLYDLLDGLFEENDKTIFKFDECDKNNTIEIFSEFYKNSDNSYHFRNKLSVEKFTQLLNLLIKFI